MDNPRESRGSEARGHRTTRVAPSVTSRWRRETPLGGKPRILDAEESREVRAARVGVLNKRPLDQELNLVQLHSKLSSDSRATIRLDTLRERRFNAPCKRGRPESAPQSKALYPPRSPQKGTAPERW